MALTGKTIGDLTYLSGATSSTLFPAELNGVTYHIPFSGMSGGVSGSSGTSGSSGLSGSSGTSGISGSSGTSGISGSSGTSGIHGTSGSSGIDSSSGTSGISGSSGTTGTSGTSGSSGISYDSPNLPSCKININSNSGLTNTNNGSDFLVLFNNTVYNDSLSVYNVTNSKIQIQTQGRYLIMARYSSFDMTDATDFLRIGVITATTSSNVDLGTKIEHLDKGYIGTTINGEASKGGSMVFNAAGGEWIGLVALHSGASGGSGGQGYPVFDNTYFNQPYLEIIKIKS